MKQKQKPSNTSSDRMQGEAKTYCLIQVQIECKVKQKQVLSNTSSDRIWNIRNWSGIFKDGKKYVESVPNPF